MLELINNPKQILHWLMKKGNSKQEAIVFDPNVPQPKPWLSCSGCRPLLINQNQNSLSQVYPQDLHLVPQYHQGRKETVLMRYGYDMRQRFEKTKDYPWSTQVFLQIKFPSHKKETYSLGSGTFIGPNTILTAAHNVRNINIADGVQEDYKRIVIIPGAHQNDAPFGTPLVKYVLISPYYTSKNPNFADHDWALIIIDRPTGNYTGWLGIAHLTDEELTGRKINIAGYPGDKKQKEDRQLWGAGDTVKRIKPERFTYWIDTAGGQSGSGVWIWSNPEKEPYIVGIHVFGSDLDKTPKDRWENQATRITPAKFQQIVSWIGKYAYKDPLYSSLNIWSNLFRDKEETQFYEALLQIVPHLAKEGCYVEAPYFKGFIEYSLKSGLLSVFTSINNSLEELNLTGFQIGDKWAKVLAENKTWRYLKELILDKNNIGDEGIKAIAANTTWSSLEILSLSENQIGDKGVQALAENKIWTNLRSLILDKNNIGDQGAKAIAANKIWKCLSELSLRDNRIRYEGAMALVKNNQEHLEDLSLDGNEIKNEEAKTLLGNRLSPQTKVSFFKKEIQPQQSQIGTENKHDEVLRMKKIQLLNSCSDETDKKTIILALFILPKEVTNKWVDITLQELYLVKEHITDDGAKILAKNKSWPLEKLCLSYNKIGDEGARHLAANTVWPLEYLNLWSNQIGIEGAQAIARNEQWKLKCLLLGSNSFPVTQFKLFDSGIVSELKKRFGEDVVDLELSSRLKIVLTH